MISANIRKYKRLYTKLTTTELSNFTASAQLWTYSIPAGSLKVNDLIVIESCGLFSHGDNTDLVYFETMLNGSVEISDYFDTGSTFTDRGWRNKVKILVKEIGSSGVLDINNEISLWYDTYFNNYSNNYYDDINFNNALVVGMNGSANHARATTKISVENVFVELRRS